MFEWAAPAVTPEPPPTAVPYALHRAMGRIAIVF